MLKNAIWDSDLLEPVGILICRRTNEALETLPYSESDNFNCSFHLSCLAWDSDRDYGNQDIILQAPDILYWPFLYTGVTECLVLGFNLPWARVLQYEVRATVITTKKSILKGKKQFNFLWTTGEIQPVLTGSLEPFANCLGS